VIIELMSHAKRPRRKEDRDGIVLLQDLW